jgi:hypothetical protein
MLNKLELFDYFKKNNNIEFSKEEIINIFSKSLDDENEMDYFLSELEVESTFVSHSNLDVKCKAGTVYFKWNNNNSMQVNQVSKN